MTICYVIVCISPAERAHACCSGPNIQASRYNIARWTYKHYSLAEPDRSGGRNLTLERSGSARLQALRTYIVIHSFALAVNHICLTQVNAIQALVYGVETQ